MKATTYFIFALLSFAASLRAQTPSFSTSIPFVSGQGGYNTYRIPAIVRSTNGTLLAFCEGRVNSSSDSGDIDIVLRRSTNNGASWLPLIVAQTEGGTNTIGNPSPVVDETTGYIHLLFCRNNFRVFHSVSTDDGVTWSTRDEITANVKLSSWGWYATGPGHGIQLKRGAQAGRLVVAADHITTNNVDGAQAIYSDDHGVTWQLGAVNDASGGVDPNETTCVELVTNSTAGSQIYFNSRNAGSANGRAEARTTDSGLSFNGLFALQPAFVCPSVEGSLLRLSATDEGGLSNRILFSCPNNASARQMISIWSSTNEAVSWSAPRLIYAGASAYSDMATTSAGDIAMLYEQGSSYDNITFDCFNEAWFDNQGPTIQSLLPVNGAANVSPTALIKAVYLNGSTAVALGSVKLFVDGANVTSAAVTSSNLTTATIQYVPGTPLAGGAHTATVTFNDTAVPANFYSNSWSFTTLATLPVTAFWQFNERAAGGISTTNARTILDSGGNSYNGTTPIPMSYVAGSPNYGGTSALDFNMLNDDYVDIPDPSSAFNYPVSQGFTVEALVKTTDGGEAGIGAVVGKVPNSATAPQWWFRINAGKLNFLVRSDAGQQFSVSGITTVTDGNWHHIAAVYDSLESQLRIYVDYALDNTASASFSSGGTIGTNMDVAIGAFPADNNRYFDGDMDFVRVSAAAVDPSWFVQPAAISPVIAFWKFNEKTPGSATSTNAGAILDSSGNGYNGTAPLAMNYVAGSPGYGGSPALDFNMSSNNYVDVPDPTGAFNFAASQSFTLEALIKTTDGGESGVGAIVGKVPTSATAPQWWFRINAGKLQFLVNNGTQYIVSGVTTVTDGNWHHVAAVYNASASSLSLYVDYVLDSTASIALSGGAIGTNQDVAIGAFSADKDRYFDGDMDFVRISAGALAAAQFVQPVNPTPPNILFSVNSGQLTLSWPQDHTGWTLWAQTNSLNQGLGVNWFPVAGSTSTNLVTMPLNPANAAVFYRLSLP